jgi:hypothetical protein
MSGNLKKLGLVGISCDLEFETQVHMNPRAEISWDFMRIPMNPRAEISWDFMRIPRNSWDLMESYELLEITGKSCDSQIPKALELLGFTILNFDLCDLQKEKWKISITYFWEKF